MLPGEDMPEGALEPAASAFSVVAGPSSTAAPTGLCGYSLIHVYGSL